MCDTGRGTWQGLTRHLACEEPILKTGIVSALMSPLATPGMIDWLTERRAVRWLIDQAGTASTATLVA